MITTIEFIITIIVVSFCATAIVCILHKKHEEDIGWLFKIICNNKTEVNRFYDQYQDHLIDYHKIGEDNND